MNIEESTHIVNLISLQSLSIDELKDHWGEYALMKDGKISGFFSSNRDALIAANEKNMKHGTFSIQLVSNQPADLGFLDCADD